MSLMDVISQCVINNDLSCGCNKAISQCDDVSCGRNKSTCSQHVCLYLCVVSKLPHTCRTHMRSHSLTYLTFTNILITWNICHTVRWILGCSRLHTSTMHSLPSSPPPPSSSLLSSFVPNVNILASHFHPQPMTYDTSTM